VRAASLWPYNIMLRERNMTHARSMAVVNTLILLGDSWDGRGSVACIAAPICQAIRSFISRTCPPSISSTMRCTGIPTTSSCSRLSRSRLCRASAHGPNCATSQGCLDRSQPWPRRPDIYANAKRCMAVLSAWRWRVGDLCHCTSGVNSYPEAQFPPVTHRCRTG